MVIEAIDDGVYELTEAFTVLLTSEDLAVNLSVSIIQVSILDGNRGSNLSRHILVFQLFFMQFTFPFLPPLVSVKAPLVLSVCSLKLQ